MPLFEKTRQRLASFISPGGKLPGVPSRSRITSYEGAYDALRRRKTDLKLTDEGLAQAAAASVWAARCLNVRASAVSRAEWYVKKKGTDERVEGETAFDRALLYAFTAFRQNLMYNVEMSLTIWGETFLEPLRVGATSIPGGLRWINNLSVEREVINDSVAYIEVRSSSGRYVRFAPDDLFWYMYPNQLTDFYGLSPMTQALEAINVSRKTIRYIQSFYDNDASPGGVLTARNGAVIDEEEEARIIDEWSRQLKGSDNAFSIIMLPHALEFTSYDSKPPENQTGLNEEQRREICGALSVPMGMVDAAGVSDPLSAGSTLGASQLGWLQNWFIPEVENIADWWNADIMPWLMPGYELGVGTDGLLLAAKQNAEHSAMQGERLRSGGISVNEYRGALGLEPKDGWDIHLIPAGVYPVREDDPAGLLALTDRQLNAGAFGGFPSTPVFTPVPLPAPEQAPELPAEVEAAVPLPEPFKGLYDGIDFTPSAAMKAEARRGLAWRDEYKRGGTAVGIARARDIANGRTLSPETVRRMYSFFSRHEDNKAAEGWKPGEDGYPSNGRIAWALWGGDPGFAFARDRWERIQARRDKAAKAFTYGNPGAAVIIPVAATPILDDMRNVLRVLLDGTEGDVIATPSSEWHITLTHAGYFGSLDESVVLDLFAQRPELVPAEVYIDGVGVFEKERYNVLYLSVEPSPELRELQAELYRVLDERGVVMSDYAAPEGWKPHITVAYVEKGLELPAGYLNLDFRRAVSTMGVAVSRSEHYEEVLIPAPGLNPDAEVILGVIVKAIDVELDQWERYELKRVGKDAGRQFATSAIPKPLALDIQAELSLAEDKATVRSIFKAAKHHLLNLTATGESFGEQVAAFKAANITEEDVALFLERAAELGLTDLLEQAETITGEDPNE